MKMTSPTPAERRTLSVIRMNRSSLERCDRILDKARFVERVRVDVDLHIILISDLERDVDDSRRRSPVLYP
jgi:hypothetical protein